MKGSGAEAVHTITDPDPGGPKPSGSANSDGNKIRKSFLSELGKTFTRAPFCF